MKQAVAFRLDADLLAEARACARLDDRSLTSFVTTAIRARVAAVRAEQRLETAVDTSPASRLPPEPTDEPALT